MVFSKPDQNFIAMYCFSNLFYDFQYYQYLHTIIISLECFFLLTRQAQSTTTILFHISYPRDWQLANLCETLNNFLRVCKRQFFFKKNYLWLLINCNEVVQFQNIKQRPLERFLSSLSYIQKYSITSKMSFLLTKMWWMTWTHDASGLTMSVLAVIYGNLETKN